MIAELNMFLKKSKYPFGSNSIKEFKHGKKKFRRWKAYKIIMVHEEAKVGARGARDFIAWTYYQLALRLHFDEDDGVLSGKRSLKPPKEGHRLNREGLKVK
jgi:hypothetical protein